MVVAPPATLAFALAFALTLPLALAFPLALGKAWLVSTLRRDFESPIPECGLVEENSVVDGLLLLELEVRVSRIKVRIRAFFQGEDLG